MSASSTPIMKYLNLAAGGTGTISFAQAVQWVYVRNGGSKNVFMAVGATPPTPSAGDGRTKIVAGQWITFNSVALMQLSFAMAGGEASYVEAIGVPVLAGS